MKKIMYFSLFSFALLGGVSCSDAEPELDTSNESEQKMEDSVTPEKAAEMEKAIKLQEEAEKLDKELDEYIKSI